MQRQASLLTDFTQVTGPDCCVCDNMKKITQQNKRLEVGQRLFGSWRKLAALIGMKIFDETSNCNARVLSQHWPLLILQKVRKQTKVWDIFRSHKDNMADFRTVQ